MSPSIEKPLVKLQFIVTHTIRQTDIPTLQVSLPTPSVQMVRSQKSSLSLYFRKNVAC